MVLWRPTRPSKTHTKKDVLFIIGDWNAKVGSQEIPGVTGEFGLGVQNEAGPRLLEFCQENALVITNTRFQQHKRRLYTWTSADGQHWNKTDYILCSLVCCSPWGHKELDATERLNWTEGNRKSKQHCDPSWYNHHLKQHLQSTHSFQMHKKHSWKQNIIMFQNTKILKYRFSDHRVIEL